MISKIGEKNEKLSCKGVALDVQGKQYDTNQGTQAQFGG